MAPVLLEPPPLPEPLPLCSASVALIAAVGGGAAVSCGGAIGAGAGLGEGHAGRPVTCTNEYGPPLSSHRGNEVGMEPHRPEDPC